MCIITHIVCNLAQNPDRVYSLYSVIGDNYRGLTAAVHYLHSAVGHILHMRAFKQAWKNTHIENMKITYSEIARLKRQRERKSMCHTSRLTYYWCNLV